MGRIPELDALRGIAALLIVLFHVRLNGMFPSWGSMVDLFFVLSGFLITGILFEHGGAKGFLPKFYARRALRILPIYYLTFPLFFAMNAFAPRPASLAALPQHLTYTQFLEGYAFAPIRYLGIHYRHTWTLAIEEQFYLFWPIAVLAMGRRRLPYLLIPMVFVPIACRVMGFFPHLLITRCDGLVLGSLLAWIFNRVQCDERPVPRTAHRSDFTIGDHERVCVGSGAHLRLVGRIGAQGAMAGDPDFDRCLQARALPCRPCVFSAGGSRQAVPGALAQTSADLAGQGELRPVSLPPVCWGVVRTRALLLGDQRLDRLGHPAGDRFDRRRGTFVEIHRGADPSLQGSVHVLGRRSQPARASRGGGIACGGRPADRRLIKTCPRSS